MTITLPDVARGQVRLRDEDHESHCLTIAQQRLVQTLTDVLGVSVFAGNLYEECPLFDEFRAQAHGHQLLAVIEGDPEPGGCVLHLHAGLADYQKVAALAEAVQIVASKDEDVFVDKAKPYEFGPTRFAVII